MKILPLTQGNFALVDDEDYERLKHHKWCFKSTYGNKLYAVRCECRNGWVKYIFLHHEVLGYTSAIPGRVVDHINGNSLDCTRKNLRICTQAQNCRNRQQQKNSRSKYKGVKIKERKSGYRYHAVITAENKSHYLGSYKDEYSAMAAYNVMAVKLHREFAYLNTWNGPSIPGQPDPLAEELEKIPHRDLVPYPHDPSERLIYIYKLPGKEKGKENKPQMHAEKRRRDLLKNVILSTAKNLK
jgi:HNH endonuclease